MRYFAGVYAIGAIVEPSDNRGQESPKRWTRCWSTRLEHDELRAFILETKNEIIRVDSIHAFGFALIDGATVGQYLVWPPGTEPNAAPTLFVEPARVAWRGEMIRILLVGNEFKTPEERTEPQCQKPTETQQT